MKRFERTKLLLGQEGLERLRQSTVTVVGMGAVGSFAVEGLARAGVGSLRLVDFDEIRESNINRQLFALESTIGRSKVEVARQRILDINPDCEVETHSCFMDRETFSSIFTAPTGALLDAIDSLGPKSELLAAAAKAGIPLILSSMGAAYRTDPSLIRVRDLSETQSCPLARLIRKRLRRLGVTTGIRCVYSMEKMPPSSQRAVPADQEEEVVQRGRRRTPLGSLACITGIFGLTMACETTMILAGKRKAAS
ncbi:MAG: tRNA threonylcarbamoyladenosine dehydratase [Lentisphaerota bacterium]